MSEPLIEHLIQDQTAALAMLQHQSTTHETKRSSNTWMVMVTACSVPPLTPERAGAFLVPCWSDYEQSLPSDDFTIILPLVNNCLTFPSVCAIVTGVPNNITPLGTHPVTVQTPRLSALPITSMVPPGAPCDAWVDEDAASI
jgi:hypothetical protein